MPSQPVQPPKVSIILCAFNEERHIAACFDSLYRQSFQDFELIAVDDASSDQTFKLITELADSRTNIVSHETNLGLTAALKTAHTHCRGEYIAKIDADEIACPDWLRHTVRYLDKNPNVGLVGCQPCYAIDDESAFVAYLSDFPQHHVEIKWHMLFGNPVMTTSTLYRPSVLEKYGLDWDLNFKTAQDYRLFSQIILCTRAANLSYRSVITRSRLGISSHKFHEQLKTHDMIAYENLSALGLEGGVTEADWANLHRIWLRRYQRIEELEHDRERLVELYWQIGRQFIAIHTSEPQWRLRRVMALDISRMAIPGLREYYGWKILARLMFWWPLYPIDLIWKISRGQFVKLAEKNRRRAASIRECLTKCHL